MAQVEMNGLHKQYGRRVAVQDVNLSVAGGEFLTLLGPSGCGKTTTLRMVAGFERADAGRIQIGGQDVTDLPPDRRNVGMVFQSYALFPNMTAWENVAFGLRLRRLPADAVKRRVAEMLAAVELTDHGQQYPHQLSGGQQQRVALARALVMEPKVLLLDEPLSALDAKIRVQLRDLLKDLQRRLQMTTIYVTHDQEEALSLSDRIAVMESGRVVQLGSPLEIYSRPVNRFVADFVGSLNFLRGRVADAAAGLVELLGQRITLPAARDRQGDLTLAVRPETIGIAAAGAGGGVTGQVLSTSLLGSLIRFRVQAGAEVVVVDQLNAGAARDLGPGAPVRLTLSPDSLLLID